MDWKFIIIGINVLVIFANIIIYTSIKFNDMKHISETTKEIKNKIDKIFRRLGKVEKDLVKREAICEERHKK